MGLSDSSTPLSFEGLSDDLRKARQAADAACRAKSQFIIHMSHELRTPLAAILGYAEMMYDANQSVLERMACIARIRHNVSNVTALLEDILELSKIETDTVEPNKIQFNPGKDLDEVFHSLRGQAWRKRLSWEVQTVGMLPEAVITDLGRLKQILINVIGNAIRFTDRGSVHLTLRMRSASEGSPALFEFVVKDTGKGISKEQWDGFFQPFEKESSAFHQDASWVGLSLSRHLARVLGGDIVLVDSVPGKGSTVSITIDPGHVEDIQPLVGPKTENAQFPDRTPIRLNQHALDGIHVLLIEDAPDLQMIIRHFFSRSGAQVSVAQDGAEGIQKAQSGQYDLVLMDIQMPIVDGYEATMRLRKMGFRVPIVALTAHAMKGVKERCLAVGFDDYVTKPINAEVLIELANRFCKKRAVSPVPENQLH